LGVGRYKKLIDWLLWEDTGIGAPDWIIEQAKATGRPIPQIVSQRPTLRDDALFYLQAYIDLMSCGNEKGVIPWTAYDQYATRYGERTDRLKRIIGALINGTVSNRHKD
jgi:hypothetical protein